MRKQMGLRVLGRRGKRCFACRWVDREAAQCLTKVTGQCPPNSRLCIQLTKILAQVPQNSYTKDAQCILA
jgi:hypothetical protein